MLFQLLLCQIQQFLNENLESPGLFQYLPSRLHAAFQSEFYMLSNGLMQWKVFMRDPTQIFPFTHSSSNYDHCFVCNLLLIRPRKSVVNRVFPR